MTKIRVIKSNGDPEEIHKLTGFPARPTLRQINDVVSPHLEEGADVEHVTVLWRNKQTDMFVDEHGQTKGLPLNSRATAIYRAAWHKAHPTDDVDTLPAIYGTAVLFTCRVWY